MVFSVIEDVLQKDFNVDTDAFESVNQLDESSFAIYVRSVRAGTLFAVKYGNEELAI